MKEKLICLCAIVGNEEKTIQRFLNNFQALADTFVFVRAIGDSAPDHTFTIIEDWAAAGNREAYTYEYVNSQKEWVHVDDFSKARNQTWNLGEGTNCKYLVWADVDDIISSESIQIMRNAARSGDKDIYIVPYEVSGKNQVIARERMIRNDGRSEWVYPVHELLSFNRESTYGFLKEASFVHAPLADKVYTERNLNILLNKVHDLARVYFFLAIECLSRNKTQHFKEYANVAIRLKEIGIVEKYELLLLLAQHGDSPDPKAFALQAYSLMPDRREALGLLTCILLAEGKKEEALHTAKHLTSLQKPTKHYWTQKEEWYTWKGLYLLTQCLRLNDREEDATKLEHKYIPAPVISVVHPTYKRPEQALAVRDMYLSRAHNPMLVEYIFGFHVEDAPTRELCGGYRHTLTDKEGCCPNTQEPLKASRGAFVMVVADDLIPPMGWDAQILEALQKHDPEWISKEYVVNVSDALRSRGKKGDHMCHLMCTRTFLENEILADPWPGTGIFSDNEFNFRAQKKGIIINAPQIQFDHQHFLKTGAMPDETYRDQNQEKNYTEGFKILTQRNPDYLGQIPERKFTFSKTQ